MEKADRLRKYFYPYGKPLLPRKHHLSALGPSFFLLPSMSEDCSAKYPSIPEPYQPLEGTEKKKKRGREDDDGSSSERKIKKLRSSPSSSSSSSSPSPPSKSSCTDDMCKSIVHLSEALRIHLFVAFSREEEKKRGKRAKTWKCSEMKSRWLNFIQRVRGKECHTKEAFTLFRSMAGKRNSPSKGATFILKRNNTFALSEKKEAKK